MFVDDYKGVVLYSSDWPPEQTANGITTYVGCLDNTLRNMSKPVSVMVSNQLAEQGRKADVCLNDIPYTILGKITRKFISRLPLINDFHLSFIAMRFAQGLELVQKNHPVHLLEIEETMGISWFIKKYFSVPMVVRLHGPWFLNGSALGVLENDMYHKRNALEKKAVSVAEGITSPSAFVLDAVRRYYDIELEHAEVIPNAAPQVPVIKRWTYDGCDKKTILFVGRFDRHKGGDIVIDAFVKIAKVLPHARLLFVGPDRGLTTRSGAEYSLKQYIEEFVPKNIVPRLEITGPKSTEEIEKYRSMSFITVFPSRFENFSLALLEALAYGCPTVVSRTGGNIEIVSHGKTGLFCKPGDAESLAEQVISLFSAQGRAAELGRNAAESMEGKFSSKQVAEQTWNYYQKVWRRVKGDFSSKNTIFRMMFRTR